MLTVNKVEGDGLEYRYTFTARADGGVAFRRSLEQSRGGVVEIVFNEDEWTEITKTMADEDSGLRSRPEELKLLPADGVKEAKAKWGVIEAERNAEETRRAAAQAKQRADREAEEAAEAKRVADEAELVAAKARAKADKEVAEAEVAELAKIDADAAAAAAAQKVVDEANAAAHSLADEEPPYDAAFIADLEKQVASQAKLAEAGLAPPPDPTAEGTSAHLLAQIRGAAEMKPPAIAAADEASAFAAKAAAEKPKE
jgi:colicin import membrane protein